MSKKKSSDGGRNHVIEWGGSSLTLTVNEFLKMKFKLINDSIFNQIEINRIYSINSNPTIINSFN